MKRIFILLVLSLSSISSHASTNCFLVPLIVAVKNQDIEKVKALVSLQKTNVNEGDCDGLTAITWAAAIGNVEITKILIEKSAEIDHQSSFGDTPLLWAAYNGNYETVKLLVEKGSNINIQSKHGWSPIMQTAANGGYDPNGQYKNITKLLIEKHADLNFRNSDGYTSLAYSSGEIYKLIKDAGGI